MVVVVVVVAETGSGPDGALLLQADARRRAPGHDAARQNRRVASLLNTRIVQSLRCRNGYLSVRVGHWQLSCLSHQAHWLEGFGERPLASVDFWKADRRFVSPRAVKIGLTAFEGNPDQASADT